MSGVTFISSPDFALREALRMKAENLPADPVFDSAQAGRLWLNTASDQLKVNTGTSIVALRAVGERIQGSEIDNPDDIVGLSEFIAAYSLSQFAGPTGPLSMNSQRVVQMASPVAGNDGATRAFVESYVAEHSGGGGGGGADGDPEALPLYGFYGTTAGQGSGASEQVDGWLKATQTFPNAPRYAGAQPGGSARALVLAAKLTTPGTVTLKLSGQGGYVEPARAQGQRGSGGNSVAQDQSITLNLTAEYSFVVIYPDSPSSPITIEHTGGTAVINHDPRVPANVVNYEFPGQASRYAYPVGADAPLGGRVYSTYSGNAQWMENAALFYIDVTTAGTFQLSVDASAPAVAQVINSNYTYAQGGGSPLSIALSPGRYYVAAKRDDDNTSGTATLSATSSDGGVITQPSSGGGGGPTYSDGDGIEFGPDNTINAKVGDGLTITLDEIRVALAGIVEDMLADGSVNLATKVSGVLEPIHGGTGVDTIEEVGPALGLMRAYDNGAQHPSGTSFTITAATHGLGPGKSKLVQVTQESNGDEVIAGVHRAANGDVTISSSESMPANTYRVVIAQK